MPFTSEASRRQSRASDHEGEIRRSPVSVYRLGRTDYGPCWDLQKSLSRMREEGQIPDALLLTEHNHVYTLGKSSDGNHLLAGKDELLRSGAAVYEVDRGGDITYHGPGQLVGYPIFDLNGFYLDLHRYLRDLEEVLIRTVGEFGIQGLRDPDYTGVWVGKEKIAAIGVKVSRWITMHGFALNVSTDLQYFDRIIPCGIFHRGVTSMEKMLGSAPDMQDVIGSLSRQMELVFGISLAGTPPASLPEDFRHQFNS
jgi:lipoyl(octanoyl) transferase